MRMRVKFASVVLSIALVLGGSFPLSANAQLLTFDPQSLLGTVVQTGKDAANFLLDRSSELVKRAYDLTQKTAVKSLMRRYVLKFAEQTAKRIARGGRGQDVLFDSKPFEQELRGIVAQETADFLQEAIKDFTGFDVCEPFDPRLKVAIINKAAQDANAQAGTPGENDKPKCDLNVLLANYRRVNDIASDNKGITLNDFTSLKGLAKIAGANSERISVEQQTGADYGITATVGGLFSYTPQNEVAQAFKALSKSREIAATSEAVASVDKTARGGVKNATNALGNLVKSPAEFVRDTYKTAQDAGIAPDLNPTYDLAVDALGVFANTLAFEMLKRATETGYNPSAPGSGFQPIAVPGALGTAASTAVEEFSSLFGQAQISTEVGAMNALNDLMTCPDEEQARLPNNCMITQQLRQAIDQKMTVGEAVKAGLLPDSFLLGFRTDTNGQGVEPAYNEGLSYRALLILQKYRVVPRSWVIAAEYVRDQASSGLVVEPTFKNLIAAYGVPSSPYYRLVDPNWVLTAPAQYCALSGPSGWVQSSVVSRVPDETTTSINANGQVSTAYKLVNEVNRAQYCADERTCVKEKPDGSCLYYGYCAREKPIWRFKGTACPAAYDSCQAFAKADGTPVSLLANSLAGTDICNASNAGCQQYVAPAADGSVASVADLSSSGLSQSSVGAVAAGGKNYNLAFFTDKLKTCSPAADGCTELVAVNQPNGTTQSVLEKGTYPASAQRAYVTKASQDCSAPAPLAKDYYAGCTTYAATNDPSNVVSAIARGQDLCSASCVGYDTFDRQATDIGGGIADPAEPFIDLIPSTAKSCSLQNVGCESFTDINAGSNAEAIVSYQSVRSCVATDAAGDNAKTYFTWQGSDTSGFGLKSWQLLASSDATKKSATGTPAPCVSFDQDAKACNDTGIPVSCDRNAQLGTYKVNGVVKTGVPSGSEIAIATDVVAPNLDCREFIARDGSAFYALASRVVSVANDCKQLRRTVDQKIYSILASESLSCSNEFAGCRAFRGNTGYAGGASVPLQNFKGPGAIDGWKAQTGTVSQDSATLESQSAADSSLKIARNSSSMPIASYVGAFADKALSASVNNVITFAAKGAADSTLSVGLYANGAFDSLGSVTLQGDWNTYVIAVRVPSAKIAALASANLALQYAAQDAWIDNFTVRQSNDVYLIKNSWKTPVDGSGAPLCGVADLGCREYKAKTGGTYSLSRFGNLCPMDFVGCQAFVDTKNTAKAESETKTISYGPLDAQGKPTAYSVTTKADELVYRVYNPDVQGLACQPKEVGCRLLGKVSYDYSGGATDATAKPSKVQNSYVLDLPDEYLGSTPVMCGPSAISCIALKDANKTGADAFAYDPRGRTCTYNSIDQAWYVTGQELNKTPCPSPLAAKPQDRFAKSCEATYSSCKLFIDGSVSKEGKQDCKVPADLRAYQPDHLAALGYSTDEAKALQNNFCQAYSYLDTSVNGGDCNGKADAETGCVEFGTRNLVAAAVTDAKGTVAYPQDKTKGVVLSGRVLQVQKDRVCAESLVSNKGDLVDNKSGGKEFVRRDFYGCTDQSGPDRCVPEKFLSGESQATESAVTGPVSIDSVDVLTIGADKVNYPAKTVSVTPAGSITLIDRIRQAFSSQGFVSSANDYEIFRYLSGISQAGLTIGNKTYGANPYPGSIKASGLATTVNYDGDFESIRARLEEGNTSNVGYTQLESQQLKSFGIDFANNAVAARVAVTNSTGSKPFDNIFSGQQALIVEGTATATAGVSDILKIGSANAASTSFGVGNGTELAATAYVLSDMAQGDVYFDLSCSSADVGKYTKYANKVSSGTSKQNLWQPLYFYAKMTGTTGTCSLILKNASSDVTQTQSSFRFYIDSLNVGSALVNEARGADRFPKNVQPNNVSSIQSPVTVPIVGPNCRVYPVKNAPSCEYSDDTSRQNFSGYYGYCLVRDPRDPRQCIQWFPADGVIGKRSVYDVDGTARKYESKYKDRAGLSYCIESEAVPTMANYSLITGDIFEDIKLSDIAAPALDYADPGQIQKPATGIVLPFLVEDYGVGSPKPVEFTVNLAAPGVFSPLAYASPSMYELSVGMYGRGKASKAAIQEYVNGSTYSASVRDLKLGSLNSFGNPLVISNFNLSTSAQNQGFEGGDYVIGSCQDSGAVCLRFNNVTVYPVVKNGSLIGIKFKGNAASDWNDSSSKGYVDDIISVADFKIALKPVAQAQYCKRIAQVVNESGEYAGWETRLASVNQQSWLLSQANTITNPGVLQKGYSDSFTGAVPYRSSIGESGLKTGTSSYPTSILAPFGSLTGTWSDYTIGLLSKPLYVVAAASNRLDMARASFSWYKSFISFFGANSEATRSCLTVKGASQSSVVSDADAQKCMDENEGLVAGSYGDVPAGGTLCPGQPWCPFDRSSLYPSNNPYRSDAKLNPLANIFVQHFKEWIFDATAKKYVASSSAVPKLDCRGVKNCLSNFENFDSTKQTSWTCVDGNGKPVQCASAPAKANEKKHTVQISNMLLASNSGSGGIVINDPVKLCFDVKANDDQLPIKQIKVDWGDGPAEVLSGLANVSNQRVCTVHTYVSKPAADCPLTITDPSTSQVGNEILSSNKNKVYASGANFNSFLLSWGGEGNANAGFSNVSITGPGIATPITDDAGSRTIVPGGPAGIKTYDMSYDEETTVCFAKNGNDCFTKNIVITKKTYQLQVETVNPPTAADPGKCYTIRADAMDNWCWNTLDNPLNYSPTQPDKCMDMPSPKEGVRDQNDDPNTGVKGYTKLPNLVIKVSN